MGAYPIEFHECTDVAENEMPVSSNRHLENLSFIIKLRGLARKRPNLTLAPAITHMEKSKTSRMGETGYNNKGMPARNVKDIATSTHYAAGVPAFEAECTGCSLRLVRTGRGQAAKTSRTRDCGPA
jgi:hypothetical protein